MEITWRIVACTEFDRWISCWCSALCHPFSLTLPTSVRITSQSLVMTTGLDFQSMTIRELQAMLEARSISYRDCIDAYDLRERCEENRDLLESPVKPKPEPFKASVPRKEVASQKPPAWPGADPVKQGPPDAKAALILLHGFGDSGGGFISNIGGPLIAMDGLRVVFPSAPGTSFGGFSLSSWITAGFGGSPSDMMRVGNADAQESIEYIHALIRREIARGVPAERIAVGGFSQGGLVAMRAALSFPDAPLGGALALSSFFGQERADVAPAQAALRVLVTHGEADPVVPTSEGRRIASSVRRLLPRADVQCKTYPEMGHSTCSEQVKDLRTFLAALAANGHGADQSATAQSSSSQSASANSGSTSARSTSSEGPPTKQSATRPDADELEKMSVRELMAFCRERGLSTDGCLDKEGLIDRALEAVAIA